MAIPTVVNFDTNRIPTEGSPTFRADASYVWSTIPTVIDSMNAAIAGQNELSTSITTSEANAAASAAAAKASEDNAKASEDNAKASEDNAATSAAQAEAAVALLPPGTIDDAMIAPDKAWSSEKIANDKQDTLVSGTNIKTIGGASILGSGDLAVSAGFKSIQVFTASGTWTKPAGITKIKVTIQGAGAGGSKSNNSAAAPGGNAGNTIIKVIDVSSISSETVTIGAGGQGSGTDNTLGTDGGSSSFGSYQASGGLAATDMYTIQPQAIDTIGDINIKGEDGKDNAGTPTGNGGSSFLGGAYNQLQAPQTNSSIGAGGAGKKGNSYDSNPSQNGGDGIVIIEEYI